MNDIDTLPKTLPNGWQHLVVVFYNTRAETLYFLPFADLSRDEAERVARTRCHAGGIYAVKLEFGDHRGVPGWFVNLYH